MLVFYTLGTASTHLVLTNLVTTNTAVLSLCIYVTKPDINKMQFASVPIAPTYFDNFEHISVLTMNFMVVAVAGC